MPTCWIQWRPRTQEINCSYPQGRLVNGRTIQWSQGSSVHEQAQERKCQHDCPIVWLREKVFTVNNREKMSRGIWKSPDQRRHRETDWSWPGLPARERRIAGRERRALLQREQSSAWEKRSLGKQKGLECWHGGFEVLYTVLRVFVSRHWGSL